MSGRLRIDADLSRLVDVRRFVREQATAAQASSACVDDVVQAVDEAATNVINHGYQGAHGWLEVDVAVEDGRCVVSIEDDAPGFDPTVVPEPDLVTAPLARKPGGMGIHLIRESTDGFSYRPRPGGGNILTIVRSLEPGREKEDQMALTTSVEQVAGRVPITIVTLEGELDASNFERLVDEIRALYDAGTRDLLLDLTDLTFLASSGLVALSSIVRIMHGESAVDPEAGWGALHQLGHDVAGGGIQTEVQLAGPQPAVERVLQRTGLDRLFHIHADRAAAIEAF